MSYIYIFLKDDFFIFFFTGILHDALLELIYLLTHNSKKMCHNDSVASKKHPHGFAF